MQEFSWSALSARYGYDPNVFVNVLKHIPQPEGDWSAGPWLAGGCIRDTIAGSPVKDWDLFFRDEAQHTRMVDAIESSSKFKRIGGHPSANAICDTFRLFVDDCSFDLQLIRQRYGPHVKDIIRDFDFTVCMFGYSYTIDTVFCGDFSLFDLARKQLVVNKILFPETLAKRVDRFESRGYTRNPFDPILKGC